ncbi:type I polyketide synthase loading module domain protein [Mycobacterium ulcerans str. Harvey]|uniref:Type I polyketide synthase loading module domain protein n=1 Tax=Mycobacterium ulcerans str. Harvey TaxID=1299332 RepID=A0ABN0RAH5_MYCUL|nr:type I polyketide synthase loading module domain protein [Mycobacterium ulcerans str. Harvey]
MVVWPVPVPSNEELQAHQASDTAVSSRIHTLTAKHLRGAGLAHSPDTTGTRLVIVTATASAPVPTTRSPT